MRKPRRWGPGLWSWAAIASGLAVCLWLGHAALGIGQPCLAWYYLGPVQVLGGPDEAWLFTEKSIYVKRPGWGAGRALRVACTQEVVIVTREGVKRRITVPEGMEVGFHPNTYRVVRSEEGFALLRGSSLCWHASLYRWRRDHFALCPREAYWQFLAAHDLEKSNVPELDPALDRVTERSGWKHLGSKYDWMSDPLPFAWGGRRFDVMVDWELDRVSLRLRSTGPGDAWEATLLEFDPGPREIPWAEYEALRGRKEPGHPRQAGSP